jgi:hypothetical protein
VSDVHVAFSLTKRDFVESGRAVFRCKLPMRALYLFLTLAAVVAFGVNLIHRDALRLGNLMVEVGAPLALMAILWFSPWLYVVQNLRNHSSAFGNKTGGLDLLAFESRPNTQRDLLIGLSPLRMRGLGIPTALCVRLDGVPHTETSAGRRCSSDPADNTSAGTRHESAVHVVMRPPPDRAPHNNQMQLTRSAPSRNRGPCS